MLRRPLILLSVLLAVLIFSWLRWRDERSREQLAVSPAPEILKLPVDFTNRTFDPAMPPADMPPLAAGESAECDSNFLSSARVGGETRPTDATHAAVTVTRIQVTLQLKIAIWTPADATRHLIEHEEGHRQISEYYYQTAEKVAERIAAPYLGKQVQITGANLDAESTPLLQEMAHEITDEYNKELNPGPAQLLYDSITDHGRNGVASRDAAAHAIQNVAMESNLR